MREKFDLNKEYGIVLEGGGAKGAYQIGVWKAFQEAGVKMKGIAGVSVGALNGALMTMGDYQKAIDIWENISYSRIIDVDDIEVAKLMKGKLRELSLQEVSNVGKNFLAEGGLNTRPLKELLEETVDEQKIKESPIDFYLGTFSLSEMKEIEVEAKSTGEGMLKDYLLASASLPIFKNEKLHGKKYIDGGVVNNVPIDMLIKRGYKDIIVVRIYGIGLEKRVKIPADVNVTYIAPRRNLCNVLEFDKEKAMRGITLGYFDAMKVIYSLDGRDYYIKVEGREELDFLNALISLDENLVKELGVFFRKELMEGSRIRNLTESIYPVIAIQMKLPKTWSYKDLYIAILEYCGKKLRIPKHRIYTVDQLEKTIHDKIIQRYVSDENLEIMLKLVDTLVQNKLSLTTK